MWNRLCTSCEYGWHDIRLTTAAISWFGAPFYNALHGINTNCHDVYVTFSSLSFIPVVKRGTNHDIATTSIWHVMTLFTDPVLQSCQGLCYTYVTMFNTVYFRGRYKINMNIRGGFFCTLINTPHHFIQIHGLADTYSVFIIIIIIGHPWTECWKLLKMSSK